MDHTSDSAWVDRRTQPLAADPRWEPDTTGASRRFRWRLERATHARRRALWLGPVALITAAALVLFLLPASRAAAQRMWTSMRVDRTAIVPARPGSSAATMKSFRLEFVTQPTPWQADDLRTATRLAGFAPRLIRSAAFGDPTGLSVSSGFRARVTLHRDELQEAASRLRPAVFVPYAWDGATLEIEHGPTIIAAWPNLILLQTEPHRVVVPDDLDLPAYAVLGLRILGLSEREARQLADGSKNLPAVMAARPEDRVSQVRLAAGVSGTILHDIGQRGTLQSRTLHWSTADRLFVLTADASCRDCTGNTDELLIQLANSVR